MLANADLQEHGQRGQNDTEDDADQVRCAVLSAVLRLHN